MLVALDRVNQEDWKVKLKMGMTYENFPALYHPVTVATFPQSVVPSVHAMQVRRKSIVDSGDLEAMTML
jgi:hypothetical protein